MFYYDSRRNLLQPVNPCAFSAIVMCLSNTYTQVVHSILTVTRMLILKQVYPSPSFQVLLKNVSSLKPKPERGTSYQFSEDKKYLFYTTKVVPIYRHTTIARYTILDIEQRSETPLKPSAGKDI